MKTFREYLQELSKGTLNRYRYKSIKRMSDYAHNIDYLNMHKKVNDKLGISNAATDKDIKKWTRKHANRVKGIRRAYDKAYPDEIHELSSQLLARYIHKADDETDDAKQTGQSKNWDKTINRIDKTTLAKLKIRKVGVKVPAGRPTLQKQRASVALAKKKPTTRVIDYEG